VVIHPQKHFLMRGFTLLELILVLVIIGAITGITTASLSKFVKRAARQDAARAVMALLEEGRLVAMHEGKPYRVVIDREERKAWAEEVSDEPLVVSERQIELQPSDPVTWSDRIQVEADIEEDAEGIYVFVFDPMGVNTPGVVWVQDASGMDVLTAKSATEAYALLDEDDPYMQELPSIVPR